MNEQDFLINGKQMYIPVLRESSTPTQTTLSQLPNPERPPSGDICMAISTYSSINQTAASAYINRSVTNVGQLAACNALPAEEILKIGKSCVGLSNKLEPAREISLSGYYSPPNSNPDRLTLEYNTFVSNVDSPYDACLRQNFSRVPSPRNR